MLQVPQSNSNTKITNKKEENLMNKLKENW
jgi:hypothetical protein